MSQVICPGLRWPVLRNYLKLLCLWVRTDRCRQDVPPLQHSRHVNPVYHPTLHVRSSTLARPWSDSDDFAQPCDCNVTADSSDAMSRRASFHDHFCHSHRMLGRKAKGCHSRIGLLDRMRASVVGTEEPQAESRTGDGVSRTEGNSACSTLAISLVAGGNSRTGSACSQQSVKHDLHAALLPAAMRVGQHESAGVEADRHEVGVGHAVVAGGCCSSRCVVHTVCITEGNR